MSGAGRENCKKRKNRESRQSPTPYDLWLSNSVCAFWWSYTLCCLDCGGKPRSRQRGQQCDVSCEMRNVPRPGWRRFRGRKEHERSGPSLTGSPKASRCATRSSHCQWQGRNAPVQEFAQRGADSRFGGAHSLAASKEIARTCTLRSSQLQMDPIPSVARRLKRRYVMDHKKNQQGKEDSPHPYLAPVPRTNDAADAGISRRGFLGFAAESLLLAHAEQQSPRLESRNGIPYRTLGRTKEKVSLIGLGCYHLGNQADPQESIRIIRAGLDEGVNFLDNCWDYNGGESEIRMGNALRDGYRQKAFLM